MWIATTFGFLSATKRPEKSITDYGSPELDLQVRARDRKALVELRRFMSNETSRIISTDNSDYPFRVYCESEKFALAMARMVFEIDYTNFKDAVDSESLHDVYLRVWAVIANHYGGLTWQRKLKRKR